METIQQLRARHGLTQRRLADALDVTTATISAWERGAYEPRASQLRRLALVFGVSMDAIDTESPVLERGHAKDPVSD